MAFDFSKLNNSQQQAVFLTKGPVIVTAGAGTGKTRLLTHRIAYLIEKEGVDPSNILAITFTNKATNEMRERILNNVERGGEVTVSTFHSLCVRILRDNISRLDECYNRFFTIYDDSDQEKILKKIFKDNDEEDEFRKTVAFYISKAKNEGIGVDDFKTSFLFLNNADEIAKYYNLYEQALKKNNALDFDDLILKTIMLFKKTPTLLQFYQNKFQYIHIDEFQDTNTVQYELASMLAQSHHNILVVGDEDQSIYGWRGANYKNLFKFREDFKEAKLIKLEENYRSTSSIIDKANKLISKNSERFDKVLFTNNASGDEVEFKSFDTDLQEADYVAKYIKRKVDFGAKLSDFAILYRVNSVSRLFENALVNNGVPYRVFGGLKFFSRAEIKNILAYLRLIVNPNDNEAFLRVINFPKRGIGKVTVDSIVANANLAGQSSLNFILSAEKEFKNKGIENFKSIMSEMMTLANAKNLTDFCAELISKVDFAGAYASGSEEDLSKLMNLKSFQVAVNDFYENNQNATLTDFLENVSLSAEESDEAEDGVVLATVHAVKGLEFKNVFIVACEENMFPFAKSVDEGNVEEERRLMYVAITRAEEKLIITCAKKRYSFGGNFDAFALRSRFISEIGFENVKAPTNVNYGGGFYNKVGGEKRTSNFSQSAEDFLKGLANVHKATDIFKQSTQNLGKFAVGTKVNHARFGTGLVLSRNGNNALIEFEGGAKKELNLEFAPVEILED